MRAILATLIFCVLCIASTPARAFWINDVGHPRGAAAGMAFGHHSAYRGLSSECRIAASLGGPCGCWASEYFFGRSVRSLWLARAWLMRFARTHAHPGVVAVWPHHVAPVVQGSPGAKRIEVADSWATHWVKSSGVFVDPHKPLLAMLADFFSGLFR